MYVCIGIYTILYSVSTYSRYIHTYYIVYTHIVGIYIHVCMYTILYSVYTYSRYIHVCMYRYIHNII